MVSPVPLNVIVELAFKHLHFTAFIFWVFLSCNILETNACQRWEYSAASKLNSVSAVSQGVLQPRVFMQQWSQPFNISLSLSTSPRKVSVGAPVIPLCYMLCLQLWQFSSSSSLDLWWFKWVGLIMLLVWRYTEWRGKIKFVTMKSTCLLRACHWVPLQLTTKPHWFHNLLLSDVSMFFSKFNWGSYTSMLLFKCSCKKFILVLNHTGFNKR